MCWLQSCCTVWKGKGDLPLPQGRECCWGRGRVASCSGGELVCAVVAGDARLGRRIPAPADAAHGHEGVAQLGDQRSGQGPAACTLLVCKHHALLAGGREPSSPRHFCTLFLFLSPLFPRPWVLPLICYKAGWAFVSWLRLWSLLCQRRCPGAFLPQKH